MSRRMRVLTRIHVASLLALPLLAQAAAETEARVIVRFKPQADSVRAKALSVRAGRSETRSIAQARGTGLGLRHGHVLTAGLSLDERTHVYWAKGVSSAALAKKLASDVEVELAVVDGRRKHTAAVLPNDTLFGGAAVNPESANPDGSTARTIDQWYLKKPAGAVVSSINAPDAWAYSTGTASTIVAVIDTGARLDHPDLAGKFVAGYDFIGYGDGGSSASRAIANDGNGADADPSDPGDWVDQSDINGGLLGSDCTSSDISNSSWHGTRVSGLIAAQTNNGLGMAGTSWGSRILPVRVLGKCGGYDSDIMAGMKWAAGIGVPGIPANANRAKVLNLSLGGSGSCADTGANSIGHLYRDTINQINNTGAVVVVAAGNSSRAVGIPGNCPGVITVGALRHVGTKVGFASLGPEVTLSAPGGNCINTGASQPCLYPMVSTTNAGKTSPVIGDASTTGSSPSVGTSFSAPIVSGVVALMASVRSSLNYADVSGILKRTARPFVTTGGGSSDNPTPPQCTAPTSVDQDECYCTTSTCGAGMLDAAAAVAAAQALNNANLVISATPATGAKAGETQTLTANLSALPAGRSAASYAWSITDGGGIATGFASGATSASATVVPSAAGSFSASLTVTDDLGQRYVQSITVSVAAAPAPAPSPAPAPAPAPSPAPSPAPAPSSGGGGASHPGWLALLLSAVWALPRRSAARRGSAR